MIIVVDLSGDYETTIYDAARRLIAAGTDPSHTVETRRDGYLSMSGKIGELAKWTVEFRAAGPRLVPYKHRGIAPPAAKTPDPGTIFPAQPSAGVPGGPMIDDGDDIGDVEEAPEDETAPSSADLIGDIEEAIAQQRAKKGDPEPYRDLEGRPDGFPGGRYEWAKDF
jgi:hypothetical protein